MQDLVKQISNHKGAARGEGGVRILCTDAQLTVGFAIMGEKMEATIYDLLAAF